MADQFRGILHTLPLSYLEAVGPLSNTYIECEPCFKSKWYRQLLYNCQPLWNSILDCGVGISADISKLETVVNGDRDFAVKYFGLIRQLTPGTVVVPDVLGNGDTTFDLFNQYVDLLDAVFRGAYYYPQLMFVIQGYNESDASVSVARACSLEEVNVVGFPRVVHYYGDPTDSEALGQIRIKLVSKFLNQIRVAGKKVHLLGMNSLEELRYVATNGLSCDTRLASMMAIQGREIRKDEPLNRPSGLKIDLLEELDTQTLKLVQNNIDTLDALYKHYSNGGF